MTQRKLAQLVVAAVAAMAVLVGCGGGSSDGGGDSSGSSDSSVPSGEDLPYAAEDTDASGLPEGFPEDQVPLPEFTDVTAMDLGGGSDAKFWNLILTVAPSETSVEDYAAMLKEAGFTVEDAPGESKMARGSGWVVNFHSASKLTLSVAVRASA